jgi:hypothetical protein
MGTVDCTARKHPRGPSAQVRRDSIVREAIPMLKSSSFRKDMLDGCVSFYTHSNLSSSFVSEEKKLHIYDIFESIPNNKGVSVSLVSSAKILFRPSLDTCSSVKPFLLGQSFPFPDVARRKSSISFPRSNLSFLILHSARKNEFKTATFAWDYDSKLQTKV